MFSTPERQLIRGLLLALVSAVGFALSLVLARMCYERGTDPETVMFTRFFAVLVLLVGWHRFKGLSLRLPMAQARPSLIAGGFYFFGIMSYLSAIVLLPVSIAVLVFYLFPLLVLIMTAVLNRRLPDARALAGVVLAFCGLMLALDVEAGEINSLGMLLGLCAALGVAINVVLSSRVLAQVQPLVFSSYGAIANSVLAGVALLVSGGVSLPGEAAGQWLFVLMMVAFFAAYLSTFAAIRLLGAGR